MRSQDDDYIYHEYLEDDNRPMYVSDFVEQARRHDLEYLGHADRGLTAIDALWQEVAAAIRHHNGDVVEQEQLLDFLANRTFRCALLCHKETESSRAVTARRLRPLGVRWTLKPVDAKRQLLKAEGENFQSEGHNTTLGMQQPVTKVALAHRSSLYPRPIAFEALLAEAGEQVHGSLGSHPAVRARGAESLGLILLRTHVHDTEVVGLHFYAPGLAPAVPEFPLVSRLGRYEALLSQVVTNTYHQPIRLAPLAWQLLPCVDGTRDQSAMVEWVVADAIVILERDGQPLTDPANRRPFAVGRVPETLETLRQAALLVQSG